MGVRSETMYNIWESARENETKHNGQACQYSNENYFEEREEGLRLGGKERKTSGNED